MKKMRGFTLIECIVALAILGIASLVMAQIYASVSNFNRANHQNNSSIANQMKYVEEKTNSEAIKVASGQVVPATMPATGLTPPVTAGTTVKNITLKRKDFTDSSKEVVYSYAVDYYVLQSRDQNDEAKYKYNAGSDTWTYNTNYQDIFKETDPSLSSQKQQLILNYKYFTGFTK